MKRIFIALVILGIGGFLAWKFIFSSKPKDSGPKQQPLAISKNSSVFNESMGKLLTAYYSLHSALVDADTTKANAAAASIIAFADSLKLSELKADSSILMTAKDINASVGAEAKGFLSETDITGKRKSFYTLSENLYNLLRTIKYDQAMVYHMQCPMAFNDTEEAFWLSNSPEVVNPYLGKNHPTYGAKMLHCGEVTDSLNYMGK
jgi:Protein of unknown function (DUF3347)